MRTAKTLIRLGGCPGWSESLLGAHSFCWFYHEAAQNCFLSKSTLVFYFGHFHLSRLLTKPTKWHVPPAKTDQPGHPPSSIRVFAGRMKEAGYLSYPLSAQRRLWSDWADAQADLSLCWAHSHFVGFVMMWLICVCLTCRLKQWGSYYNT